MRVVSVANNYGKSFDGIGAYAEAVYSCFPKGIELEVFTGTCEPNHSPVSRVLSMGMHQAFRQAIAYCEGNRVDFVIVDYPFVEWNPIVIGDYVRLARTLHAQGGKLVLSAHEYARLNPLRKRVIERMAACSDKMVVSSDDMGSGLGRFCSDWKVRCIPSNIDVPNGVQARTDRKDFVYFGLVNKAKAFKEMLKAWDSLEDPKGVLHIITASTLGNIESEHKRVKYWQDLDDSEIVRIMSSCKGCVLPIRPMVDGKNTTFATAAMCGCLCIGRFSEEYKALPFTIDVKSYSPDDIADAINRVENITGSTLVTAQRAALDYSRQFKASEVASDIARFLGGEAL